MCRSPRRLAYRVSTGTLIRAEFAKLHYPLYWHYDILGGLKGMMELGLLGDPRCTDALDLLESMRLADGWPAHARFYRPSADIASHHDSADWGDTSTRRANQWVTADALTVLRAAGRLDLTCYGARDWQDARGFGPPARESRGGPGSRPRTFGIITTQNP